MYQTLDRGIGAACESYWRREFIIAEAKSEALAEVAINAPAGPEKRAAIKALADFVAECEDRGIQLVK